MNSSSDSESDEGEWDVASPDHIDANNLKQISSSPRQFQDQPLILISGPSDKNVREGATDTTNNEKR